MRRSFPYKYTDMFPHVAIKCALLCTKKKLICHCNPASLSSVISGTNDNKVSLTIRFSILLCQKSNTGQDPTTANTDFHYRFTFKIFFPPVQFCSVFMQSS